MRTIDSWLGEYGESHRNETNKAIHWICVPAIFFSIVALLYSVKLPFHIATHQMNIAFIAVAGIIIYYASLSKTLWMGMLLFCLVCLLACYAIEHAGMNLPLIAIALFVLAWIGQFYGHKVEGQKPSFLKDLQFLLIGPAWLMSFIYKRLKISV